VTLSRFIVAVHRRAPELDMRERLLCAINTNNAALLRRFP
jgi:hypothetical protein